MKGAVARRERNRSEMRSNVLDAAQKMVTEGGFEHLTIRGIARELGYSPGAIYEYFENKEAIVCGLYYNGAGGLTDALNDCLEQLSPDADALSGFMQMAMSFRDHALKNPELYHFTYNVMKQPKEWGNEDQDQPGGFDLIIQLAQKGIDEGDFMDAPPLVIAMCAWTAAHGFVSLEVSDHFTSLVEQGVIESHDGDTIGSLYYQTMLGFLRGWTTDQGRAKLTS